MELRTREITPYQELAVSILREYIQDGATVTDTDKLLTAVVATQLAIIDLLEEAIVQLEERA